MIKEAAKSVIGYVIQFDSGAFLMADGTVGLPSYSWPTPISKEKAELRVAKWKAANPDKV